MKSHEVIRLRKTLGLSQIKLAQMTGIKRWLIQGYEQDEASLEQGDKTKISEAFQKRLKQLKSLDLNIDGKTP